MNVRALISPFNIRQGHVDEKKYLGGKQQVKAYDCTPRLRKFKVISPQ